MSKDITVNHLLLRGGTGSEWAAANPVLLKNEIGIERGDDGACKIKIGDGVTAWNDLRYYDSTPTVISDINIRAAMPSDEAKLWIITDVYPASGNGITVSDAKPTNGSMLWIIS